MQQRSLVIFLAVTAAWQGKSSLVRHNNQRITIHSIFQSQEVQFFGAVTLHSKLLKYFSEVPKENYEELKQKLLETIVIFANGPKIVLNRLCIAVSRIKRDVLSSEFLKQNCLIFS